MTREEVIRMAKYREMPCKYYIALGQCKRAGRPAIRPTVSTAGNMNRGQEPGLSTKRNNTTKHSAVKFLRNRESSSICE